MLTFIVLACHLNVAPLKREEADFDAPPKGCQVFYEEILQEDADKLTPQGCMMQSPVMLPKFMENHIGYEPRKWSCRFVKPFANL